MTKKEVFLQAFIDLETYLRIEYHEGKYNESSFMATIYQIRAKKMNSLIAKRDHFEILIQAAQLRNLMVHNEDVCVPTEVFLKSFVRLVKNIIHPKSVERLMTPIRNILTFSPQATLGEAISKMREMDYSNVLVMENKKLLGVLTERTLFYYMEMDATHKIDAHMKLSDLVIAMDFDKDPAKYFDYISKDLDMYEALDAFKRDFEEDHELELLFVTEHGKPTEAILGILTLWDLKQSFDE